MLNLIGFEGRSALGWTGVAPWAMIFGCFGRYRIAMDVLPRSDSVAVTSYDQAARGGYDARQNSHSPADEGSMFVPTLSLGRVVTCEEGMFPGEKARGQEAISQAYLHNSIGYASRYTSRQSCVPMYQ